MEEIINTQEIDALLKGVEEDVKAILKDRDRLLMKKPFTRGGTILPSLSSTRKVKAGGKVRAQLPRIQRDIVTQDQYCAELDPYMHDVLFDDNIPSICVKTQSGGVKEVKFVKVAYPFQEIIMEKQTLHMAALPLTFNLADKKPSDSMQSDFVTFKDYWDLRNQDAMKLKAVAAAKSYGDAGLLYYLDRHGEIKSRLISYEDGYVICSHNDANGDRMLETVYYMSDGDEYIDSWDDRNFYRYTQSAGGEWSLMVEPHGFPEIPLDTKRTKVAWDNGQTQIEGYERTANIFQVLQNKWGWGLLYVKGKIDPKAQKIAGNIVLNDVSIDPAQADAKFLDPPKPQNGIDTLDKQFKEIQISTGTTFILPSDIHTSGDLSGVAVQMTQSLDIQTAENGIVEWQNFVDKMVRLFKHGLAMELVNKGIKPDALTEFAKMRINAHMSVWKPFSVNEYNTMLCTMKNAGILSRRSSIELNTESRPDEVERVEEEEKMALEQEMEKERQKKELEAKYSSNGATNRASGGTSSES